MKFDSLEPTIHSLLKVSRPEKNHSDTNLRNRFVSFRKHWSYAVHKTAAKRAQTTHTVSSAGGGGGRWHHRTAYTVSVVNAWTHASKAVNRSVYIHLFLGAFSIRLGEWVDTFFREKKKME